MNKKTQIWLYIAATVVQLIVICSLIFINNNISQNGAELKIKIMPIDPYDAFRGKYIILNVNNVVKKQKNGEIEEKTKLYITFKSIEGGFSELDLAYLTKPKDKLYIEAVAEESSSLSNPTIKIRTPFERFYIEERYSEAAERVYRENTGEKEVYIKVKVLNGKSVIKDLYVNNIPIKEFIDKNKNKK